MDNARYIMLSEVWVELNHGENGKIELLCKTDNGIVSEYVAKAFQMFNASFNDSFRTMIESEYLEKINQINKDANLEKQELIAQIKLLKENNELIQSEENKKLAKQIEVLSENYETKFKTLSENIKQEAAILSMQNECELKLQIGDLSSKLKAAEDKLQTSNEVANVVEHINKNYDNINKLFSGTNEQLGTTGEQFVYDVIHQSIYLTEDSYVENVSGQADACDLFVKYKSCLIGVEVKNYTSPIKKELVKRFLDKDIINANYNAGLFVSIKTDFSQASRINHFDVRFVNGKPCLFVANAIKRRDAIILAIKMLDYLVTNQNKDKSDIDNVIQVVNSMVFKLDSLNRSNNSMKKSVKEIESTISELHKDIETVLGKKEKRKHACETCGDSFDKKVDLNRHVKAEHA